MECDFQVGDAVVCVEEMTILMKMVAGCHGPVIDEKYHIRHVRPGDGPCPMCGKIHIYVHLRELVMPDLGKGEIGLPHDMFRKMLTIDDFKSAETDAPTDRIKEPEHA